MTIESLQLLQVFSIPFLFQTLLIIEPKDLLLQSKIRDLVGLVGPLAQLVHMRVLSSSKGDPVMTLHKLMLFLALLGAIAVVEDLKMPWKKCMMGYLPNQAILMGMGRLITLGFAQLQIK